MANRKTAVAATGTVDNRPHVPGIYRWVLPDVCLREVTRGMGGAHLTDNADEPWEAEAAAQADVLAVQRLAAGTPVEVWWYELPKGLPAPLDQMGRYPAPRYVTISADDRVDASEWFDGRRDTYARARHFPNCDHGYFRAAFDLAGEFGV